MNNNSILNMHPYIAVFSQREDKGAAVVKRKDDFWFPQMFEKEKFFQTPSLSIIGFLGGMR